MQAKISYPFGHVLGVRNIALSPWGRAGIGLDDLVKLDARCQSLGVKVSTVKRSTRGDWMVRVFDGRGERTELKGQGPLAVIIAGALDTFEQQRRALA